MHSMNEPKNKLRVAVAMSGGVDSSVAAALLCQQGYDVFGITMQLFSPAAKNVDSFGTAIAEVDAQRVAELLGISHYIVDLQAQFKAQVIDYFVSEYRSARTPNPCVQCNRLIKFDLLLEQARELGADFLATGHYAQIAYHEENKRWSIRRGVDANKDQSYALYDLQQQQLAHILLPLGGQDKEYTRELAHSLGMQLADKADSQEICFIADNDYRGYLRYVAPEMACPGEVIDADGKVLGQHEGLAFYTVGQRRGLPISLPQARYVTRLNVLENRLEVGEERELYSQIVMADPVTCGKLSADELAIPQMLDATIRYRMKAQPAQVQLVEGRLSVSFMEPQRAITPGQSVVCYQGDDVACGGIILRQDQR